MNNATHTLTESEAYKLISSDAYRQSMHPEHAKIHEAVRKWFVNRYNTPPQTDATGKTIVSRNKSSGLIWKNLGDILLVGEGNLSFAKSIAENSSFGVTDMIATTYEGPRSVPEEGQENASALKHIGATIIKNVDATHLEKSLRPYRFDTIVFQFPNVGSREPIHGRNPNFILLRKFLKSAAGFLKSTGKIMISTVDNPHYEGVFQFEEAAKFAGYTLPESYPFDPSLFPGYSHVNTNDDDSALENHKKFSTWVFRLKP